MHAKSHTDMYYTEEKHTRWGSEWEKHGNSDFCKIFVIKVNKKVLNTGVLLKLHLANGNNEDSLSMIVRASPLNTTLNDATLPEASVILCADTCCAQC